jgi:hypothetical protein
MADYDFSFLDKTMDNLDESLATFDVSTAPLLIPRWNADYLSRFLLPRDEYDVLRPVGIHWNVVPPQEGVTPFVVCPRFTTRIVDTKKGKPVVLTNQECPICNAIDALVAEGKAKRSDFGGRNGIALQKKFLARILLLAFEPERGQKEVPVFKDLPLQKIIQLPAKLTGNIRKLLNSQFSGGQKAFFHPEQGKSWVINRSDSGQVEYTISPHEVFPVPEEFMDTNNFISLDAQIQDSDADSIRELLAQDEGYWPELTAVALSLEGSYKSLPPSDGSDDLDSKLANL